MALLALHALSATALAYAREHRHDSAVASVLPAEGHRSRVAFRDSLVTLVREGVVDPQKVALLYAPRGGIPAALKVAFARRSDRPILLTRDNADVLVNLLWPIGLANRMAVNGQSPLNKPGLSGFASTGGWTLGSEPNGAAYFNGFSVVPLDPEQEALVSRVAQTTFRPCCNNSTFFQDCNHGSALLGLLALGAAQGLSEDELYREALAFNSFWFPQHYAQSALYFQAVRGIEWAEADPQELLSAKFASAAGWRANVARELWRRGLLPRPEGVNCAV